MSTGLSVLRHEECKPRISEPVVGFEELGITPVRMISTRIAVKTKRKIRFIDAAELMSVEARGNYVVLHHKSGRYTLRQSISRLDHHLRSLGFVRIHRSFIVNSVFVEEIEALPTGEYLLRVEGGDTYTVTRTYKNNLRLLAASWLGVTISKGSRLNSGKIDVLR